MTLSTTQNASTHSDLRSASPTNPATTPAARPEVVASDGILEPPPRKEEAYWPNRSNDPSQPRLRLPWSLRDDVG